MKTQAVATRAHWGRRGCGVRYVPTGRGQACNISARVLRRLLGDGGERWLGSFFAKNLFEPFEW
eukprot:6310761-Alexandrium_andersonii.AAC.1